MLPQVLAGLGLLSLLSAGCLFWLERLQPLFFTVAIVSLAYQVWVVRRRPPSMRSRPPLPSFDASFIDLAGLGLAHRRRGLPVAATGQVATVRIR